MKLNLTKINKALHVKLKLFETSNNQHVGETLNSPNMDSVFCLAQIKIEIYKLRSKTACETFSESNYTAIHAVIISQLQWSRNFNHFTCVGDAGKKTYEQTWHDGRWSDQLLHQRKNSFEFYVQRLPRVKDY